jgi:hypothetical protein
MILLKCDLDFPPQKQRKFKWLGKITLSSNYARLPAEVRLKTSFTDFQRQADQKAEREMGTWEDRQAFMNESYGRQLPEMVQRAASNMWGILCLSEQIAAPDNLTMWAHYAQAHLGFAIQFDTKHQFFKDRFIRRVDYSNERPIFTRDKNSLETIQTVLVKSEEWRPESEWRMFRSLVELESRELPDGKGHFAPLPSKCISAVYLGCRMLASDEGELLETLKLPGREHIRAFKAILHPELFTLVFNPIN